MNGFIEAFIDVHMLQTGIPRSLLDHGSHSDTRHGFHLRAVKLLKGCRVHFDRAVQRLAVNHAYVPEGSGDAFRRLCNDLRTAPKSEFGALEKRFRQEYPSCGAWLTWWKHEPMSPLIFSAFQVMDDSLHKAIPDSTNPVESLHWSIIQSVGSGHEVLAGCNSLLLYCQRLQRQYVAAGGTTYLKIHDDLF